MERKILSAGVPRTTDETRCIRSCGAATTGSLSPIGCSIAAERRRPLNKCRTHHFHPVSLVSWSPKRRRAGAIVILALNMLSLFRLIPV